MGAGIGRLEGLYGLIIDSLLSAYVMLPDTTVVEVSKDSYPDLFWGIRGAGANFGFVLNATYRVYDEVPGGLNFNADFEFPLNATKVFYQALKDNIADFPPPLCLATSLQWDPLINQVHKTAIPILKCKLTRSPLRLHYWSTQCTPGRRVKDKRRSNSSRTSTPSYAKTPPKPPGLSCSRPPSS